MLSPDISCSSILTCYCQKRETAQKSSVLMGSIGHNTDRFYGCCACVHLRNREAKSSQKARGLRRCYRSQMLLRSSSNIWDLTTRMRLRMRFTCWLFVEDQQCSSPTGSSLVFSALAFALALCFMLFGHSCVLFWQLLGSTGNSCDPVMIIFCFEVLLRSNSILFTYILLL